MTKKEIEIIELKEKLNEKKYFLKKFETFHKTLEKAHNDLNYYFEDKLKEIEKTDKTLKSSYLYHYCFRNKILNKINHLWSLIQNDIINNLSSEIFWLKPRIEKEENYKPINKKTKKGVNN